MDKFNIESAKFISIIIGICFIFIIVIWHAFDYLPESQVKRSTDLSQIAPDPIKTPITNEEVKTEEEHSEEVITQETISNKNQEAYQIVTEKELTEDISHAYSHNQETTTNNDLMNNAREFTQNGNFVSAIETYQKALSQTPTTEIKAQCYQEMSLVYASQKHYGTALSFAQRAYNTLPTTSREILLARLYYKTGNIDRATERINNVLRRDFNINDK